MKKMIVLAAWSAISLASIQESETRFTDAAQEKAAQEQRERQREHELPAEIVDSLIAEGPELVKRFFRHLEYTASTEELDPKALFFYGPSGVGKTETAIAMAQKAGVPFTVIDISLLKYEYQDSAKNQLEALLSPIMDSDQKHVIIIDECARLVENNRLREYNEMASVFWGLLRQCAKSKHIMVIAVANNIERCPEMVKTKFGSSRFIEFQQPSLEARKRILQKMIPKGYHCDEKTLDQLAHATDNIPPRDCKRILGAVACKLEYTNSGRMHFEIDDFKERLERYREVYKTESTFEKIKNKAINEFIEKPIRTTANVISIILSYIRAGK